MRPFSRRNSSGDRGELTERTTRNSFFSVTLEQIRERLAVRPFLPIVIRRANGRNYLVSHPDYLFAPPVGDLIIVVDPDGLLHPIDLEEVDSIEAA
jgi:hypothetical protein